MTTPAPRINWGDTTTWRDVRRVAGPAPAPAPQDNGLVWAWEPGFDWPKFLFSFDPFNEKGGPQITMADILGGGGSGPAKPAPASEYVWAWEPDFDWKRFGSDAMWFGVPNEARARWERYADDPGGALALDLFGIKPGAGERAMTSIGDTLKGAAPYVGIAALVLLIVKVREAR